MPQRVQMSRGTAKETNGLLCVEGFMVIEGGSAEDQASPEHKDCSQQFEYSGRLLRAEAASVCDSTIIHQDA